MILISLKNRGRQINLDEQFAIEMLNITKIFPGIIANDNITLQLKKGEIHALLGENGAGKSTLMSVLFGLYQPEHGVIKKMAVHLALGVRCDGRRDVLGMWVHENEGAAFWTSVFTELKNRGVEDILIAVTDGLKGMTQAI